MEDKYKKLYDKWFWPVFIVFFIIFTFKFGYDEIKTKEVYQEVKNKYSQIKQFPGVEQKSIREYPKIGMIFIEGTYESSSSPEVIAKYYENSLVSEGWKLRSTTQSKIQGINYLESIFTQGDYKITYTHEEGTQIFTIELLWD